MGLPPPHHRSPQNDPKPRLPRERGFFFQLP